MNVGSAMDERTREVRGAGFVSTSTDEIRVSLRGGTRLTCDEDAITITNSQSTITLREAGTGLLEAVRRLGRGPVAVSDLTANLDPREAKRLDAFLNRIERCLRREITIHGDPVVLMEHTTRTAGYQPLDPPFRSRLRLSRFAFCRSREGQLVLESPLVAMRWVLVHRCARELIAALGEPVTPEELVLSSAVPPTALALAGHLLGAGFVEQEGPAGTFASDEEDTLRQWDFHDLLFHSRVRAGRYDEPIGGTFPFRGQIDPQPALKELPAGPATPLYRPSYDEIVARDPSLTVAVEARRSVRAYAARPVTFQQLGEFLYRVGRVRVHQHGDGWPGAEILGRPYPTGGSAYELEMYLTVRRCDGLDPGIYYVDTVGHQLILINEDARDRESMAAVAAACTGGEADPEILITLTSRFQRLSWKYQAIAYATTLRHTGVVYQTMYLVATAMGLAPCGLGIGDADLSARVMGLDYLRESSVGDFLLGSRPPGDLGTWQTDDGWRLVNDAEWALRSEASLHPVPASSSGGQGQPGHGSRREPTPDAATRTVSDPAGEKHASGSA